MFSILLTLLLLPLLLLHRAFLPLGSGCDHHNKPSHPESVLPPTRATGRQARSSGLAGSFCARQLTGGARRAAPRLQTNVDYIDSQNKLGETDGRMYKLGLTEYTCAPLKRPVIR